MGRNIIALDSETTGVDFKHGVKPYIVTTCNEDGETKFWEWMVDPYTRQPEIPDGDLQEIQQTIDDADTIVLQNAKFDAHALTTVGVDLPWHKVEDTLRGGHILGSNLPHNLTDMVIRYLGHDIEPLEIAVKTATTVCRKIIRAGKHDEFEGWRLAEEDQGDMPSVNAGSKRDEDKPWKNDMWLPRALLNHYENTSQQWDTSDEMRSWLTVTSEYANGDSSVTLPLWLFMEKAIKDEGLWTIYKHCMKLTPIAYGMEHRGVSISGAKTDELLWSYGVEVAEAADVMLSIAADAGHDLELPNGAATNDSLREMFYGSTRLVCDRCGTEHKVKEWTGVKAVDGTFCPKCAGKKKAPVNQKCKVKRNPCLNLEYVYNEKSKSGNPTMDKGAMDHYETTLPDGPALTFIHTLKGMRSRATAVGFMKSYKRFWLPIRGYEGWYTLHPSFNPNGTDTLRWSSYNPNATNISRKEDFNLRYCFGPAPGREWWSMDYRSIERRIPAYESGEPKMLEVFERPDEPPYWGNLYNLSASILYPEEYWPVAETKDAFKKEQPRLYKHAKFFDLAKQYGCGREKADLLSGIEGSFDLVDNEFPLLAALQNKYLTFARKYGYVETIPDRSVSDRGYPLLVSRTEDGHVSGTTPFNYHISGTAMQTTNGAMIRCEEQIREWNADGWDGFMTMQIHDELVFDMPKGDGAEPWRTNLPRAQRLRGLMELGGTFINVPTPVSMEYHSESWATGLAL